MQMADYQGFFEIKRRRTSIHDQSPPTSFIDWRSNETVNLESSTVSDLLIL